MEALLITGLVVASIGLYFLPSILAYGKDVPSRKLVILVNILLGWTIIMWVVALVILILGLSRKASVLAKELHLANGKHNENIEGLTAEHEAVIRRIKQKHEEELAQIRHEHWQELAKRDQPGQSRSNSGSLTIGEVFADIFRDRVPLDEAYLAEIGLAGRRKEIGELVACYESDSIDLEAKYDESTHEEILRHESEADDIQKAWGDEDDENWKNSIDIEDEIEEENWKELESERKSLDEHYMDAISRLIDQQR